MLTFSVAQEKKAVGGCPFLTASAKSRDSFRDSLLAAPRDVEALADLGRRRALCPYYGGRAALPEADLVLLPYGALLLEVFSLPTIRHVHRFHSACLGLSRHRMWSTAKAIPNVWRRRRLERL